MTVRLAELMFVEVIRRHIEDLPDGERWALARDAGMGPHSLRRGES